MDFNDWATTLLDHTPQLYHYKSGKGIMEPVATSIIFRADIAYFLITAKHVFNKIPYNEIVLMLNGTEIVSISGDMAFFRRDTDYDNIDIILLKLTETAIAKIKTKYSFLDWNSINFFHKFASNINYLMLGYIGHKTIRKGLVFMPEPFGYLTNVVQLKKMSQLGLTPFENFTLIYSRRKQSLLFDAVRSFGPKDLTGLSGGGVWVYNSENSYNGEKDFKLVGIMIEQLRGTNRGIVVATKMNCIAQLLVEYFGIDMKHKSS